MLALLPAAIVAHALALSETLFANAGLNLGFASSLSLTLWLAMLVYGLESLLTPLPQLLRIAAPVAAAASLLPLLLSGHPQTIALHGWAHKAHIVVALLAYGLYTLAIFHALLLVATERRLHRPPAPGQQAGLPLLTQERLLFRLVQTAFVFLSLTILSGALFSNEIFGKPFVLTHKAVFGFAAWALFAILLIGRHLRGWRGNTAIRWMLAGFFFLVLAYTGSRFVLEFVLGRSL
ncbi:cytochrome C assembly family protein [Candidatus Dactylopiibacterium carminicum]|nr:cytochrome c biogenesis protein CcsA [Candidatus Dactylopiibacterium carminicum]